MKLQTKKTLCKFVIAIGMLNFLAFAIIATCLGGDADNGRVENGRYFFSSHGKQTEVSEGVYNYSLIHKARTFDKWCIFRQMIQTLKIAVPLICTLQRASLLSLRNPPQFSNDPSVEITLIRP